MMTYTYERGDCMDKDTEYCGEMTNEEYREKLISIFVNMDRTDILRFWYRYISAIEKAEG